MKAGEMSLVVGWLRICTSGQVNTTEGGFGAMGNAEGGTEPQRKRAAAGHSSVPSAGLIEQLLCVSSPSAGDLGVKKTHSLSLCE